MDGKNMAGIVGIWLVIKSIINLCIGFSRNNVIFLLAAIAITVLFYMKVPFMNYIAAGLMAIVVVQNLPYNITHFQIIYLIEAAIDIVGIAILVLNKDIREQFKK